MSLCENLYDLGLHSIALERQDSLAAGRTPSMIESIPSYTLATIRNAFAELHLLHDFSLVCSYLNYDSPMAYPDPAKVQQARLLLPGLSLEHEYNTVSFYNTSNYDSFHDDDVVIL